MATVKETLDRISLKFEINDLYYGHGTTNAWDEAVFLVLTVAGFPLDSDTAILQEMISKESAEKIDTLAHRRVKERIPMPYLLNRALFAGIEFYIDQRVLIPRSPFAELILSGFEPWIGSLEPKRILEVGTGSGCMAIASALVFPEATVDAVDISAEAIKVARHNISDHHLQDRINLIQSDLFCNVLEQYDLILSNPPYVDLEDMSTLPQEFKHEPVLALASGTDGLNHTHVILKEAAQYLKPDGMLFCEVGNSALALETAYPKTAFTWIDLDHGGQGIFQLGYTDIQELSHGTE